MKYFLNTGAKRHAQSGPFFMGITNAKKQRNLTLLKSEYANLTREAA